jgi:hypothetical protein
MTGQNAKSQKAESRKTKDVCTSSLSTNSLKVNVHVAEPVGSCGACEKLDQSIVAVFSRRQAQWFIQRSGWLAENAQ